MHALAIQVIRFVDGDYPGWVECELVDADGCRHTIIDKVPMLLSGDFDAESKYPIPSALRCEVLKRFQDETGRDLVCVSTARPDGIETTKGETEFTVPSVLVSALNS
jgi:hypothetical protein